MGLVALERRQREEGQRFWYNAYCKTELAMIVADAVPALVNEAHEMREFAQLRGQKLILLE
jgi:hypothetical protein